MEVRARNSNSSNSSDSNNNLSMGELLHKAKEEERRDKRMAEKSSKNSIISAKKLFRESHGPLAKYLALWRQRKVPQKASRKRTFA